MCSCGRRHVRWYLLYHWIPAALLQTPPLTQGHLLAQGSVGRVLLNDCYRKTLGPLEHTWQMGKWQEWMIQNGLVHKLVADMLKG